jgi:hypothetical protein
MLHDIHINFGVQIAWNQHTALAPNCSLQKFFLMLKQISHMTPPTITASARHKRMHKVFRY